IFRVQKSIIATCSLAGRSRNRVVEEMSVDDASAACEDLKFFERRLTEVIGHMQPRATKWRIVLLVISLTTLLSSYQWIVDPTLRTVAFHSLLNMPFLDSMSNHKVFSIALPSLLFMFAVLGIHRRVFAPSIIAARCREALSAFSLSCDENGKLIVKPAIRAASHDLRGL
ncbi:hypothetical protein PFISCL1PPCAC_18497, partial [Pristionchus fissidentatus]